MKTSTISNILLATALVAGNVAAFAQATGTAGTPGTTGANPSTPTAGSAPAQGMGNSQQPATVGVTPQTANEANRQAVPRSDTGTVVRTSPNAVDSTRNATGMSGSNPDSSSNSGMPMRAARADRN